MHASPLDYSKSGDGLWAHFRTLPASLVDYTVIALFVVGYFIQYRLWQLDDALIVARIVRNILEGHGWTYNVGEVHNASTSVLNTILISVIAFPTHNILQAGHLVGAISLFGAGTVLYLLFRAEFPRTVALVASSVLMFELATNATWGLETNLFIFLALLFVWLEVQNRNSWPVLGLLILTRPDGLLLLAIKWLKDFVKRHSLSLRGVATVLLILSPWLIFSLLHFHQVFPDTLQEKMWQGRSGFWGDGAVYYKGFANSLTNPTVFIYLVVGAFGIIRFYRSGHPLVLLAVYAIGQQIVYSLLNVPGYHWYYSFFQTIFCVAALYEIAVHFVTWDVFPKASTVIGILVLLALGVCIRGGLYPKRDGRHEAYTRYITQVDAVSRPGRLATLEVGSIGYATDRKIVDIVGLTTSRGQFITRNRMDAFFQDPPELVLLRHPPSRMEKAIASDPRFERCYEPSLELSERVRPMRLYSLRTLPGAEAE